MTRLLTTTAAGLLLGVTPALAQTDMLTDETQSPPALEQPASPSEAVPMEPSEPGEPIPGVSSDRSSQMSPDSELMLDRPSTATLDKPISPEEAEDAIEESASLDQPMFAGKQASDEWLASNLVGQPVMNAGDETIGDINDLVTNENGEVVAVLVGVGGFLGLGEKDVAVRYEDLTFSRAEDQSIRIGTNLSSAMLNAAPDYQRLNEQSVTVGENTTDIQKDDSVPSDPGIY
ncbi:MAG TPA: PRC-barrel domain-containing protein [Methyloceanibacter sp.]|nr:PRC-barrel domain-containing protein [Methyloceanibacter sp.]